MSLQKLRKWRTLAMPATALLFLGGVSAGCGGGGGGNNSSSQASLSATRSASIRVVQQSRQLPTLIETVNGSGLTTSNRSVTSHQRFTQIAQRRWSGSALAQTRQATDLSYSTELGLYYRETEDTLSYRVDFYKDAAGTQGAGNVTFNVTGLTTGRVNFDITDGNLPLEGSLVLTRLSETNTRVTGTVRETRTGDSISPDLTVADSGTATGSIAVKDNDGTINYRNVNAQESGTFTSDLEYKGATGNVIQNADGDGRVRLGVDSRVYEASYAADGAGTLTLFNNGAPGQGESITDFDTL